MVVAAEQQKANTHMVLVEEVAPVVVVPTQLGGLMQVDMVEVPVVEKEVLMVATSLECTYRS